MAIAGLTGGGAAGGGGQLGLMLQLALQALSGQGGIQQVAQQAGQAGLAPPIIPSEGIVPAPGSAVGALIQPTAGTGPAGVPGAPGGVSPNLGGQSGGILPKPPVPPEAEKMNKQAALLKAIAALQTPEAPPLPPAAPAISPAGGRQIQGTGLEQLLAALLPGGGAGQVGPSLGALISGRT